MNYNIKNHLRVFTSFSGYDSQLMALDRLKQNFPDFDYELVGWSEIDKYAIQAHDAIYPQYADRNYGDISKIEWEKVSDFDLFTYSSPCQDFSQAGKQRGGTKGSGTRSSLLWECEKAIIEKRPKYLLMENVSALVSSKFVRLFNAWQSTLESYGYKNFAKVLNAKDFQIPQNRERIFLLSIRDDGDEPRFNFPKEMKLEKRLKDILETEVDEKYYLSEKTIQSFSEHCERKQQEGCGFKFEPTQGEGYAKAISTHAGSRQTDNFIAEPVVLGWTRDSEGNVTGRHPVEVANCVTSGKRENTQNYVVEPKIVAMRGREPQVMTPKRTEYGKGEVQEKRKNIQQLEPRNDGLCNTLTSVQKDNLVIEPCLSTIGNLYEGNPQAGRIYDPVGISPTLDDMSSGGLKEPKIIEPINTDEDGNAAIITAGYYKYGSKTILGDTFGTSGTAVKESEYRIRKLTERECFRLMDMPEEYIDKIQQAGISRSQQYKMAGNSIVVSCLYHIFRKAFIQTENENSQLTLF